MHNPCMYLWVSFVTNPSLYKVLKGMPLKKQNKNNEKGFVCKFRICYKSYPPPLTNTCL